MRPRMVSHNESAPFCVDIQSDLVALPKSPFDVADVDDVAAPHLHVLDGKLYTVVVDFYQKTYLSESYVYHANMTKHKLSSNLYHKSDHPVLRKS